MARGKPSPVEYRPVGTVPMKQIVDKKPGASVLFMSTAAGSGSFKQTVRGHLMQKTVLIETQDGRRRHKVLWRTGSLVVHRTSMRLGGEGWCYTLTDAATGRAYLKHLPSVEVAKQVCQEIQAVLAKHQAVGWRQCGCGATHKVAAVPRRRPGG